MYRVKSAAHDITKIFCSQDIITAGIIGTLHTVLQFTHISRPGILLQGIQVHRRNRLFLFWISLIKSVQKSFGTISNVLRSLAQWRDLQFQYIQTIIKILAEPPLFRFYPQVPICSSNDPHVQRSFLGSADSANSQGLHRTQKLRLKLQWHFTNFIQKQSPMIRQFKFAWVSFAQCAGKCAFFITK